MQKVIYVLITILMFYFHTYAQDYSYLEFVFYNNDPYYHIKYSPKDKNFAFIFNLRPEIGNYWIYTLLRTSYLSLGTEYSHSIMDNLNIVIAPTIGFDYYRTSVPRDYSTFFEILKLRLGFYTGFKVPFNKHFSGYFLYFNSYAVSIYDSYNEYTSLYRSTFYSKYYSYVRVGISWTFVFKKRK